MDFVYLTGASVMFVTLLGLVVGCDKLGVRK